MRNALRLALVAAVAAVALPTPSANAIYCGELDLVCQKLCEINQTLHRPCPR